MGASAGNEIIGTALEIAQRLTITEYGDYPDLYSLREIYSRYCKAALENNEIVLILTYYETNAIVRQP
jgi:hypothetical protein